MYFINSSTTHFARAAQNPSRMCSRHPPFARNAKDGARHLVADAREIKNLGHPPSVGFSVPTERGDLGLSSSIRPRNSRTSTDARQATTALRPHASASSRFAHFSSQKPPTCSLVSRYGPSVMSTLPPGCARSDLALLTGERPPAKILAPAAAISSLSTSISRIIASPSRDPS